MPTYEYECKECNHKFEVFQSISSEPLKECPKCKGLVERLIGGGIGFISVGSNSSFNGTSCGTCSSNTCSTCGK